MDRDNGSLPAQLNAGKVLELDLSSSKMPVSPSSVKGSNLAGTWCTEEAKDSNKFDFLLIWWSLRFYFSVWQITRFLVGLTADKSYS